MGEKVVAATILIPVTTDAGAAARAVKGLTAGLKKTNAQLIRTNKNVAKTSKLMKGLKSVLPFAGLASIAIAFKKAAVSAIDAEETTNKFNVTFKNLGKEANASAKNLVKNYGLAATQSRKLLSDTGDLLTGLGFLPKTALESSSRLNELAADLASFTNISGGTERASAALTSALVGNREAAKDLGIIIREDDLQARLAAKGLSKLTGSALLQAKATETLNIAYEQSKNALGDFKRSQNSAANVLKVLQNTIKDVFEELGSKFTPALRDLALAIKDSLKEGGALRIILSAIGTAISKVIQIITVLVRAFQVLQAAQDKATSTFQILSEESKKFGVNTRKVGNLVGAFSLKRLREEYKKAQESGNVSMQKLTKAAINAKQRIEISNKGLGDSLDKLKASLKNLGGIQDKEGEKDAARTANVIRNSNARAAASKKSAKAAEEAVKTRAAALALLAKAGDSAAFLAQQRKAFAEQVAIVRKAGLDVATLERFQQQQRLNQFKQFFAQTANNQNLTLDERQATLNTQLQTVLAAENISYQERLAAQTAFNEQSKLLEQQRFQAIAQTTSQIAGVGKDFINIAQSLSTVRQNQIQEEINALEARGASEEEIEAKRKALSRKAAQDQKKFSSFAIILDTAVAITKALASTAPPFSYALAALSAAKGAAQLAAVQSTPIPAAQFGGSFEVPPGNEADSALVRVNQGENVDVTPTRGTDGSSGRGEKVVNLVVDGKSFRAYFKEELQLALNSGDIRIDRGGVVRTA